MEFITTHEEAVDFVSQFVNIEDFCYQRIEDPKSAGFVATGEEDSWICGDIKYKNGALYYNIGEIEVSTVCGHRGYNHSFALHGLDFNLTTRFDMPPVYYSINIEDKEESISISTSRNYYSISETNYTDIDNTVLSKIVHYDRKGEIQSVYFKNKAGFHSCRSGPAVVRNGVERYYINGARYNKAAWERLRI